MARNAASAEAQESKLRARARAGDETAFEELVAPLLPGWIRVADQILRNATDAEDAALKVLERLWSRVRSEVEIESVEAYGRRAAANEALDMLRARRRRDELAGSVAQVAKPGPLDRVLAAEGLAVLDAALAGLGAEDRLVVELHAFHRLPLAEVAARFRDEAAAPRGEEWAKKRYQRACRRLKETAAVLLEGKTSRER